MNNTYDKYENLDHSIDRLSKLEKYDYKKCKKHSNSIRELLKEYLRRLCIWADHLNYNKEIWPVIPFFDVKNLGNERLEIYDLFLEKLEEIKIREKTFGQTTFNLYYYLNWELEPYKVEKSEINLYPPYEPFILLLERGGGGIQIDKIRFFVVGGGIKERATWERYISMSPIDISQDRLDRLDNIKKNS